jgi:hypothetical protein
MGERRALAESLDRVARGSVPRFHASTKARKASSEATKE